MTIGTREQDNFIPAEGRRPPRRRSVARWAALTLCGLYAFLFLWKIPSYYVYLRDECLGTACGRSVLTPLPSEAVASLGLTDAAFAGLYTGLSLFFFSVYLAVAVLILRKRPKEPMSWIAAVALNSQHITTFILTQWEGLGWLASALADLSMVAFIVFLLLFPDGRIVRGWMFWTALGAACVRNLAWYFPEQPWGAQRWPIWLTLLWMIVLYGTILWSRIVRYRRHADVAEKQQTKWVVYGLLLSQSGIVAVSVAPLLADRHFYSASGYETWKLVMDVAVQLLLLLIPVTLGISMLKKRLWDVDPIVNRTIVYGVLSTAIVALYSLAVWYLSIVFRTGPNMILSVLGAGLVAFAFAPLKARIQRIVNRLVYGGPSDPYSVLEKLGQRLKEPSSPDEVLDIVVRTVKDSLRLPYAAIRWNYQGEWRRAAAVGQESGEPIGIPLIDSGQEVGTLLVCARSPEEKFGEADWKLLRLLARQAGSVVRSVKQSMDIQLLLGDLLETREQLIFAREEERRSMRKNLHDDIAPRLAALRLTSSLAADWIRKDPNKAIDLLSKFKQDIGETVDEIRGIVYDLRPQALDELGLIGAVRQRIEQVRQLRQLRDLEADEPFEVELEAPDELPILPAAVEVGAYRILTEALVNVVKHARASLCRIRISLETEEDSGALTLLVADNGIGLGSREEAPASAEESKGGLGLFSLRERAEELGGSCYIGPGESGGTRIEARLPLRAGTIHGRGSNHAAYSVGR
ncbi:GAF domain-containing sensor histidine kinase [Cohnella xylanilytica]|uniref:histidine kinase n=1 Tax=Cohnella xylanilytica TaxID=557555 RepID=A0A841U195_9BACL|nr:GAF domain-containing sensor histidine kinase [Cohnella xylanilytica]MBB6692133.1 GAF domain-containing sensor histidine kinase [Cohnella xylanilytica]